MTISRRTVCTQNNCIATYYIGTSKSIKRQGYYTWIAIQSWTNLKRQRGTANSTCGCFPIISFIWTSFVWSLSTHLPIHTFNLNSNTQMNLGWDHFHNVKLIKRILNILLMSSYFRYLLILLTYFTNFVKYLLNQNII